MQFSTFNLAEFMGQWWASLIAQVVKNPPAMQETPRTIPGSGRSAGEGIGYTLQDSGLENSTDCIVHGVAKSGTH